MIIPLEGEKKKRSCEINCPSSGFHAILDMKDTSLVGRTHSRILDKRGENRAKSIAPVQGFVGFRVCRLAVSGLGFVAMP